jgi:hypothetical protein
VSAALFSLAAVVAAVGFAVGLLSAGSLLLVVLVCLAGVVLPLVW